MQELRHTTGREGEIRRDSCLPRDSAERSFRLLMDTTAWHFRILLGTIIAETVILAVLLAKGFNWS